MRLVAFLLGSCCIALASAPSSGDDKRPVGRQPDGSFIVPTNQVLTPAGTQVMFPGRPVDLAFTPSGDTLIAKSMTELVFIDWATGAIQQRLARPSRNVPGFSVVGLVVRGDEVYAGDAKNHIRVAKLGADGKYAWEPPIPLKAPAVGGAAHPSGMAWQSEHELWVASTRGNNLQLIDLRRREVVATVPVGVAPFGIVVTADTVFVSNWGGDPPKEGEPQAQSSDTPIRIDPKSGISNHGSISVVRRVEGQWKQTQTIEVGLHPSGMVLSPGGGFLYVANANSDSVSVIATKNLKVVETIVCRPDARLPFGSGSNALGLAPKGDTLWVANGTNNCLAWVRLGKRARDQADPSHPDDSKVLGFIPTGWYPGAVRLANDGKTLCVANIKGVGSLDQPRPEPLGRRTHDHLGSVSLIPVPDDAGLAAHSARVLENNRLNQSLAGLAPPRPDAKPQPLPERHGEPSVFKHVVYIIKENRTYDQVFGDMKEGKGMPHLCIYGEKVTPNHHALARQFTLFDNFYCSGVLSADGHSWVSEAYVTDYLERSFGGFTRSYPDHGEDPLAYPSSGFIWDNALRHGKTIRNYGEFIENEYIPKTATWTDCWNDYKNGTQNVKVVAKANVPGLVPHTHPGFPWFPLMMPDVYRAKLFIEELKEFEKKGTYPNLVIMTLPCDHAEGTDPKYPTPRAMVADNDLALGQVVEALTHSKFWKDMCIFVVEDDPQDGFDHVDAHRTVALVISPYTKRKFVDSNNYNQTGMVKSIELILGIPPMNQLDLAATPMRGCFQATADLTPYKAVPNQIPLDEMNPPLSKLKGEALHWAKKTLELNLHEGDKADEDTYNRILWHAAKGDGVPYPVEYTRRKTEDDD